MYEISVYNAGLDREVWLSAKLHNPYVAFYEYEWCIQTFCKSPYFFCYLKEGEEILSYYQG